MKRLAINYGTNVFTHGELHIALLSIIFLNKLTLLSFSSTFPVIENIDFFTVFL